MTAEEFERQFRRADGEIHLRMKTEPLSVILREYRKLELSAKRHIRGLDPRLLLEVKRRATEGALTATQIKKRPIEESIKYLRRLERLGHSNLLSKFFVVFPFARFSLTQGHKDLAHVYVSELLFELENALSRGEQWCSEAIEVILPLADELGIKHAAKPLDVQLTTSLNRITARAFDRPFRQVRRAFKKLSARVQDEDPSNLDAQRRIAERVVEAAQIAGRPLRECQLFLEEVERLGYRDFGTKVSMLRGIARYCAKRGDRKLARGYVREIMPGLRKALRNHRDEGYQRAVDDLLSLQKELRAGGTKKKTSKSKRGELR
jgi:hypothetical protein